MEIIHKEAVIRLILRQGETATSARATRKLATRPLYASIERVMDPIYDLMTDSHSKILVTRMYHLNMMRSLYCNADDFEMISSKTFLWRIQLNLRRSGVCTGAL